VLLVVGDEVGDADGLDEELPPIDEPMLEGTTVGR